VQTTRPERRNVARVIVLPGDVLAVQEATVYAKTPGYLERIAVDKGDRVQAGQVIATIRAPELKADTQQAVDAYRSAVESAQVTEATGRKSEAEQKRSRAAAAKVMADYAQAPATV